MAGTGMLNSCSGGVAGQWDAERCGQDFRSSLKFERAEWHPAVSWWTFRLVHLSMTLFFVPARSLVGDPASTGPQARERGQQVSELQAF